MADGNAFAEGWSARFLSILRIVSALLYMQHGAQKLFGFFATPQVHAFPLFSVMGLGGVFEFFGGLLVLLGLFTRPVAFILSGQMAVAYFMFHAPKGFWPILNGGDLAVLFSFVFLYLAAAGGGAWGLDHMLRRKGP
jgi:putative oxidoreductase